MKKQATKTCYVCSLVAVGSHMHHVVPRSEGGKDGPQVPLCGSCHGAVHGAAKRATSGKSYAANLAHLNDSARARAENLVAVAVAAARYGTSRL